MRAVFFAGSSERKVNMKKFIAIYSMTAGVVIEAPDEETAQKMASSEEGLKDAMTALTQNGIELCEVSELDIEHLTACN